MTSLFDFRTQIVTTPSHLGEPRVRIITTHPETLNRIHRLLLNPAFVQATIFVDFIDNFTLVIEPVHSPYLPDITSDIAFAAALIGSKAEFVHPDAGAYETYHLWELWLNSAQSPSLETFTRYFDAYRQVPQTC